MSPPPAVEARGVSFTYRGGARPALSRVDLDLADGQWGLLVGPGGAGKTTLVRCLHRSIPQFHAGDLTGSIRVSGRQIEGQRVAQMASQVGVVFQDFESQIFSTTCLLEVAFAMENRGLPPGSIPGRAEALLESVGLAGFADRDPVTLSGGEKQRLVIAAVLALDPSVLLLDEPASDLDSGGRSDVYAVLGRQKDSGQRPAVLLVEHDLEGLPPTDGGALLVDGCVTSSWGGARGDGVAARAAALRRHGVRPPPVAELIGLLAERGAPPAIFDSLGDADPTVEAFDLALKRAGWTLRRADEHGAPPSFHHRETALECEGLTRAYAPREVRPPALDGVDLSIREGEMLAIIGANGSGKTTLARLLSGLEAPTSGRALLKGMEVHSLSARQRAPLIGHVFQNPDHQIFASTAQEEVAFGPRNFGLDEKEVARRVGEALEAVGLTERRDEDPFTMTKGERQRLALASVLSCAPEVIVMDEPTTGLDSRQQDAIMAVLEGLNRRGHTVVIITHALWLVRDPVRRVVVMAAGRIVADGPPRRILTDPGVMGRTGLRMPDLCRLAASRSAPLLTPTEWAAALAPPAPRA